MFFDTVLNSDYWVDKVANSDYILSVFDIITPAMTNNSQEGFNANCSGITTGYAYQCFDKSTSSGIYSERTNTRIEISLTFPSDYKLFALKTVGSVSSNTTIIAMSNDMSFSYLKDNNWTEFASGMKAISAGSSDIVSPYYSDNHNMSELRIINNIVNGIKVSYSPALSQEHANTYLSMIMKEIYVYGKLI